MAHDIMSRTTSESCVGDEISQLWSESENLEVRRFDVFLLVTMLTCLPDGYVDGLLAWSYNFDKQDLDPCVCKSKGSFQTPCHGEICSLHKMTIDSKIPFFDRL